VNSAQHTEKLSEIADLNPSLAESLSSDEPVSFVPMSAVTAETASTSHGENRCYGEVSKGYTPFRDGDLLVAKITPCFENGKIAQATLTHRFGFGSTEFHVIRPKPGKADARYLLHFLRQDRIRRDGERKMTGSAGQRRVPGHFLAGLSVPLPPLPEQRRIAEILDKADALRAKRRAVLAQLDTLTQSIFLDMFGDPATNPKGWKKTSLEELFEIARGGSPRPIDDYITDAPDGINWIMIGDTVEGGKYITVTKKRIRPEGARRSRAVKPGDFLLTNSMSFGRPYILRTTGCIHDGWLVLSPRSEEAEPNYFYALLGSKAVYAEFARRAPGATVKNLNIDLVRDVIVPVPPLPAQRKFAALVATIERSTSTFSNALVELDALFSSLQHRAFQGNL
jgi:type I restriction enzyme S subunit